MEGVGIKTLTYLRINILEEGGSGRRRRVQGELT